MPLQFLEHIANLCFDRRFSKQNSVIRLKSNILATHQIFRLATPLCGCASFLTFFLAYPTQV